MNKATWIGVLVFAGVATASDAPALKPLYDQHRWFELREAIKGQDASPLYKGTVASAFNDTKAAKKYLSRTIKLEPNSASAEEAHEKLAELYIRSGKYREAVQQLDQALRMKPASPDLVNARALFAAWSKYRDQSIGRVKSTSIRGKVNRDGVRLPVSIHGQTVHWALDTAANFSLISESEARILGIAIDESSATIVDFAGGTTRMRTAVVDELAIGDVHLRNAPFLVLPDSQPPMSDLRPGERGLIGIPVAIALRSISWSSEGTFKIRPESGPSIGVDHNLSFDGLNPVTRAQLHGREVDCIVDTGDQSGSQLWTRFVRDFATLVKERGTKSSQQVTMVGGSNTRETIVLPEVQLRVGGLNTTLRPAEVFSDPVGDDFHHGLLGLDVLSQAREVRIDFGSMTLELLP